MFKMLGYSAMRGACKKEAGRLSWRLCTQSAGRHRVLLRALEIELQTKLHRTRCIQQIGVRCKPAEIRIRQCAGSGSEADTVEHVERLPAEVNAGVLRDLE